MTRVFTLVGLCLLLVFPLKAQFFQFSQRDFTAQRVNPAKVGLGNFFHAMMNFRNQSTVGDFNLLSTTLDVAYPISWTGERRGGVGVFLMDDRSGSGGIYNIQEAGLSTAFSVPVSQKSSLNMGLSLAYQRRSFDFASLSTGTQFVPDRGFDPGLSSGENFGDANGSFLRWNAGVYWHKSLTERLDKAYFGLAIYDLNKPDESVLGTASQLQPSFVAEGGFGINRTHRAVIWADGFAYGTGSNVVFQGGIKVDSEIQKGQYLKILARYSTENYVIVGAGIERDNFEIGATYDIGTGRSAVTNQSAFELGLRWKVFVQPKGRKKRKKGSGTGTRTRPKREVEIAVDSLKKNPPLKVPEVKEEIVEQDTTAQEETGFSIGKPTGKKRIEESFEVRLPFKFNSYALSDEYEAFLDDILQRLLANPDSMLKVTGHTDDRGTNEVNDRISLARAQAIADYLISKGIGQDRIKVDGKGERQPISTNATIDGRALNRRVEIKILK